MQKRRTIFSIFFILLIISVILVILSTIGILTHVSFINNLFAPLQRTVLKQARDIHSQDQATQKLQEDNNNIMQKMVDYKQLQADNTALRDQFQISNPASLHLLPAHIVGAPGFIPNTTAVEAIVIDKGLGDGVRNGSIVVYKDNLVGKVTKVSDAFSQVTLISNTTTTFTAKTLNTHALGIIRGQGNGDILFDNIVIDQTLPLGEIVVTNGDVNVNGQGYPPNLIIGKTTSVEKNPSALFQRASVKSLIDISKLDMVFVIVQK